MGTTSEKLNKVLETKEAIKQALINKGVQVSDTDSFASYIGKIEEIPSGGSSSSLPTPIGICGLAFWIDGQCNTRNGKDHSKKYMENLVWNKPYSTSTSNREVFPSASSNNVWKDDILKMATYAYYPVCNGAPLSWEMVFYLDDDFDGTFDVTPYRQEASTSDTQTFIAACVPENGITFRIRVMSQINSDTTIEKNKKYYAACTLSGTNFKTFVNGGTQSLTLPASFAGISSLGYAGIGLGSGGQDQLRWKSLNVGMVRMWSRVLSDEEIQANYADAKTRFGF